MNKKPFRNGDLIVTLKPIKSDEREIPAGTRGWIFFANGRKRWVELRLKGSPGIFSGVLKRDLRHGTPQERTEEEANQTHRRQERMASATLKELEISLQNLENESAKEMPSPSTVSERHDYVRNAEDRRQMLVMLRREISLRSGKYDCLQHLGCGQCRRCALCAMTPNFPHINWDASPVGTCIIHRGEAS